jgi:hypothetical protein
MAGRNYPRLDIYEFGARLLETGDLDPVYIALSKMEWMDAEQRDRWLIAYWCFYHCGAASYISEAGGKEFWQRMSIAAKNETEAPDGGRWPRGSERRHFRGEAAVKAVTKLWGRFMDNPHQMVEEIAAGEGPLPYALVAGRAKELPLFGPWISFKVCDMLDRLGIVGVDFDQAAVFMFDDPVKSALMFWRWKMGLPENAKPKDQELVINEVVAHLTDHFKGFTAPPHHERPVGLQEVETVLCKHKSHLNGHYPLFNDIDEIRHGLTGWAEASETARGMLHAMPKGSH